MDAEIKAIKFRNYEDLKKGMTDIIKIYEDFKKEFLKRMDESGLLNEG